MTLGQKIESLNGSAILKTVVMAYAAGLCIPIGTMVVPHFASTAFTSNYVEDWSAFYRECLVNSAWWYIFTRSALNSAIGFTVGALLKTNAFDKVKDYFPGAFELPIRPSSPPATLTTGVRPTDLNEK